MQDDGDNGEERLLPVRGRPAGRLGESLLHVLQTTTGWDRQLVLSCAQERKQYIHRIYAVVGTCMQSNASSCQRRSLPW